jgi:hypothetical protein
VAGRGRAFLPYLVQVVWAREARCCPYPPLTLLHQTGKQGAALPTPKCCEVIWWRNWIVPLEFRVFEKNDIILPD